MLFFPSMCEKFQTFFLRDYEYGEKKKGRDVLGDVVGDNFLGAECLMTGVCVRFAYSSQVMRCTFRCLIGDIPRCLQLTQLFMGPEMDPSS